MNLRSNEAKLKRQLSQVQDKVRQLEGKRQFDPSKAFQKGDNVENEQTRTPLKGMLRLKFDISLLVPSAIR